MKKEAITKKNPTPGGVREMMLIALPMVVSYACDTVMMFTDRLLLSKLGPDHMNAAVGGGLAAFFMLSFGFGLIGYSTALVAQYFGAQENSVCPRVTAQALAIAVFLYPLILIFRPLIHELFEYTQIPSSQFDLQIVYFDIMIYGSILVLIRHALSSFFSGIGRTHIVMLSSFLAMIVNIAASYILIYGKWGLPAFGVKGAAYGSLIGSVSSIVLLGLVYFNRASQKEFDARRSLKIDWALLRKLIRFGLPSGVEMFLVLIAANGMILVFHSMGPVVATASSILFNWDMVAYIPLMGMEIGVTSLVGRYMGAKTPGIAHRSTMSGLKVGCAYAAGLLLIFGIFPEALAAVFRPQELNTVFIAAEPMAIDMLRLIALYVLSAAITIVFIGALRGAGDTLWAMSYHVSLHWLCVIALYVSTRFFGANAFQGWVVLILTFLLFSTLAWRRYHSGKWKTIHVID